jgi:uncharacterized membrane protein YidH (DUF202 family)
METRFIIAYALCAVMALVLVFALVRYVRNRRQFKIRQMGRGKNLSDTDQTPSQ